MPQNGSCLPGVALRRRHEFQATVLVLLVVPAYKLLCPRLRLFQAVERLSRVIGPVLASAEQ